MRHMKNMIIGIISLLLLLIGGSIAPVPAQSDGEYGTTMNLGYGAGARALSLGRAYVAMANDPTAVFWNPAGLEIIPRTSFTLFHNQLFEGTMYDFVGFAYPTLNYGTVGIGFTRVGTDDIPYVSEHNVVLGSMNYEEDELYISYAKKLPFRLYGGLTFKFRRQSFSLINQNATGLGLDFGLMYRPEWESKFLRNLGFGFSFRNLVSPDMKLGSRVDNEPYFWTLGLVKGFEVGTGGKVNLLLDFGKSKFESGSIRLGTEYIFRGIGSVRLGYDNSQFALGAGIKYSFVRIDYSFGSSMAGGDFPPTHRFSLTFDIGKSRQELIMLAEEKRKQWEKELVERTKEEERQNFIKEHLKKGKEYLAQQRFFDAYVEFQQVISVDPFNKTGLRLLDSTNTLIQQDLEKRQQEAIARAVNKELAEENRRFVKLHFEKGQLYLQKNQFTDALTEFNLALERSPDDPIILEAIATTKRRLEDQVRKLISRGRAEFQKGNYSGALQILSEALVLAPENPELKKEINILANRIKLQQYIQQALQLYDFGEYQKALKLFEEALKLDPNNERLKQYIERTKRGMGVVKQEMDPESERLYLKGVDLFLIEKYEEALKIWKELQKKYPYNKKLQDNIKSAEERLKHTKAYKK